MCACPLRLRPVLRRFLPADLVGRHVAGYTELRPFLVNGAAYGGLVGTVTDAVKLAAAHVSRPARRGRPFSPHGDIDADADDHRHAASRFDHGIGWFRKPTDSDSRPRFVEHYGTGGGYWNAMRIYPERRLAIVAMTNTTSSLGCRHALHPDRRALPWN